MHPMPIGTWVRLTMIAAVSFVEVPVSCHIASDSIVAFGDAAVCESSRRTGATPRFKIYGLTGATAFTGAAIATGAGGSAAVADELIAGAGAAAGISVPAG